MRGLYRGWRRREQRAGVWTEWDARGNRVGAHGRVWYERGRLQGEYEYDRGKTVRWREWSQRGRELGRSP